MTIPDYVQLATLVVLLATAGILMWYTIETFKLRKQAAQQTMKLQQANTLAALTEIHKTLSNDLSRRMRAYLYLEFADDLGNAARDVLGKDYVSKVGFSMQMEEGITRDSFNVRVDKVLNDLKGSLGQLSSLNLKLSKTTGLGFSALDAVEHILLDFDIVALPLSMKIESAREIAQAYRPIFERTAPAILPFVAIQLKLRGSTDPRYKEHYRKLLKELNIDLQGIEAPNGP